MTTTHSTALRLFFLIPICLPLVVAFAASTDPSGKLIKRTCRYTKVHYDFCVAALSSHPNSRRIASGIKGLAAVALDLATKNATSTAAFISQLQDKLESEVEPGLHDCLTLCKEQYADLVELLNAAKGSLEFKYYEDVIRFMDASRGELKPCQEQCRLAGRYKNVLTKRNKNVSILCSIVLTFTSLLR